jgi:cytochrome bd-type quinol oxidase subunit 2
MIHNLDYREPLFWFLLLIAIAGLIFLRIADRQRVQRPGRIARHVSIFMPIIGCVLMLNACSSTNQQKAVAAVASIQSAAATLATAEAKAAPLVAQVSGSNAKMANALSYAQTISADAQILGPLLSGLISAFPTTTGS